MSLPPTFAGAPPPPGMAQPAQQPQPPPPQQQQLFGAVVPGCPVRTDFVAADATGLKFTLDLSGLPVPPSSVPDIALFLLPGAAEALPPGHGALLYWEAAVTTTGSPMPHTDSTGFELLGAVSPDRPSGLFRTGWGSHSALTRAAAVNASTAVAVTLGISIEPLANIHNLQIVGRGAEDRLDVARKIARNLFNFLQSFDDTSRSGFMTVPHNVFERWMTRFENKFRVDPNFFMKGDD